LQRPRLIQIQALRAEHQLQAVPGIEPAPAWQVLRGKSPLRAL
jgi:hypothetical protein